MGPRAYYELSIQLSTSAGALSAKKILSFLNEQGYHRAAISETILKKRIKFQLFLQNQKKALKLVRAFNRQGHPGKCTIRYLEPENWWTKWQRYFKKQSLGKSFYLLPEGERADSKMARNRRLIVLDPKGAFGSGSHDSTKLAVRLMEQITLSGSFLDVGTGTGLLTLCAHQLGAQNMTAVENDRASVVAARHNFALNRCPVKLYQKAFESAQLSARFNVIAANLISSYLENIRSRLCKHLKTGGFLVVSGIHRKNAALFLSRFKTNNLKLLKQLQSRSWSAFLFQKL